MLPVFCASYLFVAVLSFLWLDERVDYSALARWRLLVVSGLAVLAGLVWPVLWVLVWRARLKARGTRRARQS